MKGQSNIYDLDEEGFMNMAVLEGVVYPHCDPRVLHSPGTCEFCDEHPDWQAERVRKKIDFTNDKVDEADASREYPCPSFLYRDRETIEKWWGNRAHPKHESKLTFPDHPIIPTKPLVFRDERRGWLRNIVRSWFGA